MSLPSWLLSLLILGIYSNKEEDNYDNVKKRFGRPRLFSKFPADFFTVTTHDVAICNSKV